MRRRIPLILIALAAGFVVQYAIAMLVWRAAVDEHLGWVILDIDSHTTSRVEVRFARLYPGAPEGDGVEILNHMQRRIPLLWHRETLSGDSDMTDWREMTWAVPNPRYGKFQPPHEQHRFRCGVPFLSLGGTNADPILRGDPKSEIPLRAYLGREISAEMLSGSGVLLPRWLPVPGSPHAELRFATSLKRVQAVDRPTRVYVAATAGNTVFWALVFFTSVRLTRRLVSSSRRRRGLCVKCKYQMAGLTTCPECGTAGPQTRSRRRAWPSTA